MITEDILEAVKTTLTGLTTTGSNVQREQAYDIEQANLPFIVINEGEDIVEGQRAQAYIDWALTVDIDLLFRADKDTAITSINTMRNEVHTALMVDYTLGIPASVKYIGVVRTERPTVDASGDRPIVRQRVTYEIKYRSNWANLD
jgi:hypothetical protein